MKIRLVWNYVFSLLAIALLSASSASHLYQSDEFVDFPQKYAWAKASPSVVWCGDPESTTTLEVHIVGRDDVRRVWLTGLGNTGLDRRGELFDDGSHGDLTANDNIYTLADYRLPCKLSELAGQGWGHWEGFLRVELSDGTQAGNWYPLPRIGIVDRKFQNTFEVQDYGNGLSATAYAFFINDSQHEIFSEYPLSELICGRSNFQAYQKLYSVFPDMFDFAAVMPGMQIFHPDGFGENVPYAVRVSNQVENIGMGSYDNTEIFGSAGRLRTVIFHSFGDIAIMDHELGHAWAAYVGQSLGLLVDEDGVYMHWITRSDVAGQMGGAIFLEDGKNGQLAYNGDETWRWVSPSEILPYSPLELYLMGMIPASEVPDVHILEDPDYSDPLRITAKSYKTITIDQILQAEGGERVPSVAESQKDFNLAFIAFQDEPFNDAAYAFFSLLSHEMMSKNPPWENSYYAPFYWATGGRGTLDTRLPVEVESPAYLPGDANPTPQAPDSSPAENSSPQGQLQICGNLFGVVGLVIALGTFQLFKKRTG